MLETSLSGKICGCADELGKLHQILSVLLLNVYFVRKIHAPQAFLRNLLRRAPAISRAAPKQKDPHRPGALLAAGYSYFIVDMTHHGIASTVRLPLSSSRTTTRILPAVVSLETRSVGARPLARTAFRPVSGLLHICPSIQAPTN